MEPTLSNGEVIGTLGAGLVAAAVWLRKLKPAFATDDKVTAAAVADTGIIERLEKECNRLGAQNEKLANSLNGFQDQLLTFQTENNKLSRENNALREENLSLREEIIELRREVQELSRTLMEMQRKS